MKLLALFVASAAAVQTANLTFHSTSEYYRLLVPADGSPMQANNLITVDYIDAPDYLASQFCTFSTPAPFNMSTRIGADGRTRQLVLHPPSVIESVACEGKCVGTYGDCYDPFKGQYIGPCCNGFCAANKCRSWDDGQ